VLDIRALDIYEGEVFCLVGPSGAGKSTLLRLLNFLEPPSHGVIEFRDQIFGPDTALPIEIRRRVTTVFQRPVLLDQSVWDNIIYGLRIRGMKDSTAQIQSVLEEVGLSHLAHQRACTLSGGEAQRVALARAMVLKPEVLLLDEPTANLDPYNVDLIEGIVRKLNLVHGTTLILVTHNVFQARRLAQRVALLLEGKPVEVGNVDKFFNAPQDPRTAAFVRGEMVY
jgi:tungstate transport system ATP-binding protein